jgi:hypothetical protein
MENSIKNEIAWDDWYEQLKALASSVGVSVADKDAWRESFDDGSSPEDALFGEYPDLRPKGAKKQHKSMPLAT